MAINVNSYLGNTNLKGVNVQITYTPEQLREYMKCAEDPMYFVEKYVRIINVDSGLTPLKLRPFQKKIVKGMIDNRFVICKIPRQSGKCVTEETEIYVKNKKRNEPELIQIGQFYERISNSGSPECIIRDPAKFEKEYEIDDWEVLTPGGWKHFCGIGKTKKFRVHVLETDTKTLRCADKHVVFREGDDPNFFEDVFVENLKPGDKLLGQKSIHTVRQVIVTDEYEHMYDLLDVNSGNCYYTNEILSHNSTTVVSFLLHYILFNKNVSVALLANKLETAQELMDRLKLSYENLPKWLQQGIVEWNKRSIVLENGSKVKAGATSATAIRGQSFNCIVLDEFAHISSGVADEFFSSAFPTITSGKSTKLVIVSTPNGMNMFYRLWEDAVNKKNDFVPIEAHWSEVPNRDEKFKTDTIAVFGERRWAQEFDCAFLGSDNTLISPSKLSCMSWCAPIYQDVKLGLDIYEEPIKNKTYVLCVDTSRGEGLDYHAATIIDVTCLPYRVVAKLRNNHMSYQLLPDLLNQLGKQYNEAHILVELNDLGQSVADSLHMDHEYENLIFVAQDSKGQKATFSSSGKTLPGVKTSKTTKSRGCSTLKDLIEMDKLLVTDFDIITEFSTYVSQGAGYEATEGNYDDTVSTLVSFAWLTTQPYFQEVTSTDIKKKIFAEKARIMTESLLPFGMYNDGIVQTDYDDEDIFAERKHESIIMDDYAIPINIPKTERADIRDTSNWKQEFNFD